MKRADYQDVLDYIDKYWSKVAFQSGQRPRGGWRNLVMHIGAIDLPKTAFAPNHTYFAGTQFYWDSYFNVMGLVDAGQGTLARGMIDNLCFLYKQFDMIPARNSRTSRGRSQPPFLTRMAWEVHEEANTADNEWTDQVLAIAAEEYEKVWHGPERFVPEVGLSRYNPKHGSKWLTTYESGWDSSTRFAGHNADLLPVDLNALLYQYETDFLNWASKQSSGSSRTWKERLDKRKALITQYLWDEETGFFYDYDLKVERRSTFRSLAGFTPLWSGAATQEQAKRCIQHLADFEYDYGLAMTEPVPWKRRQWDYPNGWAPLHYLVITGLRRYGFNNEAFRIAKKWLDLNQDIFKQTGTLWEKYDVISGKKGLPGRYPTQPGFTWTNAVFLRLFNELAN